MQPDQAYGLAQFLLPNVEREHKTTRKVLAAVPADKGDYQPDPKSMSAFELAWHLASSEHMFTRMALDGVGPQPGPRDRSTAHESGPPHRGRRRRCPVSLWRC